jgi:hypothetical protein
MTSIFQHSCLLKHYKFRQDDTLMMSNVLNDPHGARQFVRLTSVRSKDFHVGVPSNLIFHFFAPEQQKGKKLLAKLMFLSQFSPKLNYHKIHISRKGKN